MLSKNELKYIQSLCHKKQREETGLFIAEGPKLVQELLQSHYGIKKVYATDPWYAENKLLAGMVQAEGQLQHITEAELARISALQAPNQVLAVVAQKNPQEEPMLKGQLSLVLDGIRDPGNMGTLIRIADWFGITQVIASEDTVELYNPKVIQATMGSFVRVNTWYRSLPDFMKTAEIPVYGALLNGQSLYQIPSPKEALLVIGNESKGISGPLLPLITHPVTIPRIGGAESLNAAVATGILLSHFAEN